MKKKNTIQSIFAYYPIGISLIGGLALFAIGVFAVWKAIHHPDKHVISLFLSSALMLFGMFGWISLIFMDVLELNSRELTIRSIFGFKKDSILVNEIISYSLIQKRNKYMKWEDLTLYTPTRKYKITSSYYQNYESFKTPLINGLERNTIAEKRWNRKQHTYFGFGFTLFGLFFTGFLINKISFNFNPQEWGTFILGLGLSLFVLGIGLYYFYLSIRK